MSKNVRSKFKKSELADLRARVVTLVASANASALPERRVSVSTAITVANRELTKNSGSSTNVRAFNAIRAVSSFISLAQRDRATPVALMHSDLLPVGHPRSTKMHEMSDESVRYSRAQWIAADPLISEDFRGLVAAAHSYEYDSVERRHAFARLSVLGAHKVPLTASIDPGPIVNRQQEQQPLVAGVLGLVGGNSAAARRLRAQLQRRDRYGKFAFMGGGFSFKIKLGTGDFGVASGRIVGRPSEPNSLAPNNDLIDVEIVSSSIPEVQVGKIYRVPSSKGISAKAILPQEVVESLPDAGKVSSDDVFVTPEQLQKFGILDAPSGWKGAGVGVWNSEDGYTVSLDKDTGKYSVKRSQLDGSQFADSYDSWSDVQKAVIKDQASYTKDVKGYNALNGDDAAQAKFAEDVAARGAKADDLPDMLSATDVEGYVTQIQDAIDSGSPVGFSYRENDVAITPKSVTSDGLKLSITDVNDDVYEFDSKQMNIELPEKPEDPKKFEARNEALGLAQSFKTADYTTAGDKELAKYSDAYKQSGPSGEPIEGVRDRFKKANLAEDQYDTFVDALIPGDLSREQKRERAAEIVGEDALSSVQFGTFSEPFEADPSLRLEQGEVLDLDTSSSDKIASQIADIAATGNNVRFGYNGTAIELEAPYEISKDNGAITGYSPVAGDFRTYNTAFMKPFSEDLKPAENNAADGVVDLFEPFGVSSEFRDIVSFMEEAKNNGLRVRINYDGQDYDVSIKSTSVNKKTGRPIVNVDRYPSELDYDKIRVPEKKEAPEVAEVPEAPEAPEAAPTSEPNVPRDPFTNMRERDPNKFETYKDIYEGESDEQIEARMALDEIYNVPLGGNYLDEATGERIGGQALQDLAKKYDDILKGAEAPEEPEFISPYDARETLDDGLSTVSSALGDIPEEDLDNLDEEDSDALSRVNDLLDSAQEALDQVDPVGSDTNDLHFEQARADLGEAAQILSEANNGDMQNAGLDLQQVVNNFINLPQIDFSGRRAERAELEAEGARLGEPIETADTSAPEFDEAMFDEFFTAPEGAYKPDIFTPYSPKGRTDEVSPDFTDDPEVLSGKFDSLQLATALRDAIIPKDDENATGYGMLQFSEGDESVKAEAIVNALENQGIDVNTLIAEMYDDKINLPEGQRNVDKIDSIEIEEPALPDDAITEQLIGKVDRDEQIRLARELNGQLGEPTKTSRAVSLIDNHQETNPLINDLAQDLRDRSDNDDTYDPIDFMNVLDEQMRLALSDNKEENDAFRSFWGLVMSIDGGDSGEDNPQGSLFRGPVLDSLERVTGSREEASTAYNALTSKYGGYPEFVAGKEAIADGTADLTDDNTASALFRLVSASSRENDRPLYRSIGVHADNPILQTYTTVGSEFSIDPRSFTDNPMDTGGFEDIAWSVSDKALDRVIFKIDSGDGKSISVDSISWFGESEHLVHGTYKVVDVKRQKSILPGRPDDYVVKIELVPDQPRGVTAPKSDILSATGPRFTEVTRYGDISDWVQVGYQAGSNQGGFYNSPDGREFYIKKAKSQSHADNEALASAFYKEFGVDSTDVGFGDKDGDLWVVSPLIQGATPDLGDKVADGDNAYLDKIRENMAIDAWLSNYDVVGLVYDNIVSDENGDPVRVDPGGALMWRAQGAPKAFFTDDVNELDGLRDPDLNYAASRVFGSMTEDDIRESAKKLLDVTPSRIDEIIDSVVSSPDDAALLKTRLKNRRQNILDRFGLEDQQDVDVLGPSTPITDAIGFEAQDLQPGDVTLGDAFTIEKIFRDADTPKGKVSVLGYFPGHETQRKEWNEKTNIPAVRGGEIPQKGDKPALHRPKGPQTPKPPAFTGSAATLIDGSKDWIDVSEALATKSIIFFDYETTGFPDPKIGDTSTNQPVQLGAVKVEEGEIVDRFNIFMNPDEPLGSWSAANLKGPNGEPLTDAALSAKLDKKAAHEQFVEWAGPDSIFAAHHAPFDIDVLTRTLADQGIDYTPAGVIDTKRLAEQVIRAKNDKNNPDPNGPDNHRLGTLYEFFTGESLEGWHSADADSEAVFTLLQNLIKSANNDENGRANLENVLGDASRYDADKADYDAKLARYKDELAAYVADKAAAAAFNCGGTVTAAADRDPDCNAPTLDEMIADATPTARDLEDLDGLGTNGDAYTSGENDLTPTPNTNPAEEAGNIEEVVSVGPQAAPSEIGEAVSDSEVSETLNVSYDDLTDFVKEITREGGNLKPTARNKVNKTHEKVTDIVERLNNGEISREEATDELQALVEEFGEVKSKSEEGLDLETYIDGVFTLGLMTSGEYWERPTGKGLPPKGLVDSKNRPVGYSKNGIFVTPGTRVRDKWGFAGTVVKYNEADPTWCYVKVNYDIDPIKRENVKKGKWGPGVRSNKKHTATLTVLRPEDDQHPWIDSPSIPESKKPEDIELQLKMYNEKNGTNFEYKKSDGGDEGPLGVKPEGGPDGGEGGGAADTGEPEAGTTEALRQNVEEKAKEAEREAKEELPKGEAPSGASEAPKVDYVQKAKDETAELNAEIAALDGAFAGASFEWGGGYVSFDDLSDDAAHWIADGLDDTVVEALKDGSLEVPDMLRPLFIPDPESDEEFTADGYYFSKSGERFWGRFGGAGLLVRRTDPDSPGQFQFFLAKRSSNLSSGGGKWSYPGGAHKNKQDADDAVDPFSNDQYKTAYEEFAEEIGFDINGKISIKTSMEDKVANDEWTYSTFIGYVTNEVSTDIEQSAFNDKEVENIGWFTADEIEKMIEEGSIDPAAVKSLQKATAGYVTPSAQKLIDISVAEDVDEDNLANAPLDRDMAEKILNAVLDQGYLYDKDEIAAILNTLDSMDELSYGHLESAVLYSNSMTGWDEKVKEEDTIKAIRKAAADADPSGQINDALQKSDKVSDLVEFADQPRYLADVESTLPVYAVKEQSNPSSIFNVAKMDGFFTTVFDDFVTAMEEDDPYSAGVLWDRVNILIKLALRRAETDFDPKLEAKLQEFESVWSQLDPNAEIGENMHLKYFAKVDKALVTSRAEMYDPDFRRFSSRLWKIPQSKLGERIANPEDTEELSNLYTNEMRKGIDGVSPLADGPTTGAGRPAPIVDARSIAESNYEDVPSLMRSVDIALDASKPKRRVTVSSMVDSSDIEDTEVLASSVLVDDGFGNKTRKLRLTFKLTPWAGGELSKKAKRDAAKKGDWTESKGPVVIPKTSLDAQNNIVESPANPNDWKSFQVGEGYTYKYTSLDDPRSPQIAVIRQTAAGNPSAAASSSNAKAVPYSFHNMVTIDLPVDASQEEIEEALKKAGVSDVRAADKADVEILAENKLMSMLSYGYGSASTNESDQVKRDEVLGKIKEKWGVTAKDVVPRVESDGRIVFEIPREVAEKIAEDAKVNYMIHKVATYGLGASKAEELGMDWSSLSPKDQYELSLQAMADMIESGSIKSTVYRFTTGKQSVGQSSNVDVRTGGAGYVFLSPRRERSMYTTKAWYTPSDESYGEHLFSTELAWEAADVIKRADFYTNYGDKFGKKSLTKSGIDDLSPGAYESLAKHTLGLDSVASMTFSKRAADDLKAELRKRGVTEIGGRPIDEVIVEQGHGAIKAEGEKAKNIVDASVEKIKSVVAGDSVPFTLEAISPMFGKNIKIATTPDGSKAYAVGVKNTVVDNAGSDTLNVSDLFIVIEHPDGSFYRYNIGAEGSEPTVTEIGKEELGYIANTLASGADFGGYGLEGDRYFPVTSYVGTYGTLSEDVPSISEGSTAIADYFKGRIEEILKFSNYTNYDKRGRIFDLLKLLGYGKFLSSSYSDSTILSNAISKILSSEDVV